MKAAKFSNRGPTSILNSFTLNAGGDADVYAGGDPFPVRTVGPHFAIPFCAVAPTRRSLKEAEKLLLPDMSFGYFI